MIYRVIIEAGRAMNRKKSPDSSAAAAPRDIGVQNIILAGFMGSGKSTVGRILARRLHWRFIDTDQEIERESGRTVGEIFDESGEEAFRDLESALAERLTRLECCIVATGGGFMIRRRNLEAARRAGEVILLVASPEQIWHRVGGSARRPLLQTPDPQARIRELLEKREEAYGAIPTRIATDGFTPDRVADEILNRLHAP